MFANFFGNATNETDGGACQAFLFVTHPLWANVGWGVVKVRLDALSVAAMTPSGFIRATLTGDGWAKAGLAGDTLES